MSSALQASSPSGPLIRTPLSCVRTIEDVLFSLTPSPYSIDVSIVLQSVRVRHGPNLAGRTIEFAIEQAGFDIEPPTSQGSPTTNKRASLSRSLPSFISTKQSKHIAQCSLCQSGGGHTNVISQPVPEKAPEDSGPPAEEQGPATLSLSIGGMTCAACSNTLTRLLSEVDGVSDAVVDLMGHSARVVVNSQGLTSVVVEAIEGAGFDAEVVKTEPLIKAPIQETTTRTMFLRVDGMHCQ